MSLNVVQLLKLSARAIKRSPSYLPFYSGTRSFRSSAPRAVVYANADQQTFNKAVNAKDRVVLVDFYADWCGPCHQLSPIIERLTNEPSTTGASKLPLDLVKIDTDSDDGQSLGAKFKISALPTVIAFRDGEPIAQFVGALNEARVQRFINEL
ncbi:thioredoxin-like protein [Gymnopilus junonius]|uniref:Thioredoxin-like protein n=1 Tax=Gymnopilus junonius TaxID=109634 RepID=A0A9P5P204_GYMJU|nr:thioredoxin-like protein [Gymnopilus junonius]